MGKNILRKMSYYTKKVEGGYLQSVRIYQYKAVADLWGIDPPPVAMKNKIFFVNLVD